MKRITFGQWGDLGASITDESKLYIPTLDEFCIGFIYYEQYAKQSAFSPNILGFDERCGFTLGLNGHQGGLWEIALQDIWRNIENGSLKVKILDADDFKELGWEPLHEEYLVFPWFSKTENDIIYQVEQFEDGRYKITSTSGTGWEEKEDVLFDGKIRNKFELSKIFNKVKWDK